MTEPPRELGGAKAINDAGTCDPLSPLGRKEWKTPHVIASKMSSAGNVSPNSTHGDGHTSYSS